MRPFDLNTCLRLQEEGKAPKIVTRDGRSVRIICYDIKTTTEKGLIGALVMEREGYETFRSYFTDGRYMTAREDGKDLFFADLEEEPTYRPYKDAEECFKDVVKHGGWVKNTSGQYLLVLAVTSNTMNYADNISFHFERACRYWVWADDNSPVGVKEGDVNRALELEDGRTIYI